MAYQGYAQTQAMPNSQLILPNKLQFLPLFIMSLCKSPTLQSSPGKDGLQLVMQSPLADKGALSNQHASQAVSIQHASQATPSMALWMAHPLFLDVSLNASELQEPGASLLDKVNSLDHMS